MIHLDTLISASLGVARVSALLSRWRGKFAGRAVANRHSTLHSAAEFPLHPASYLHRPSLAFDHGSGALQDDE